MPTLIASEAIQWDGTVWIASSLHSIGNFQHGPRRAKSTAAATYLDNQTTPEAASFMPRVAILQ
jgi:hypothetical protein